MQIKEVAISKIKPYKKNAKKHPAEQVTAIANSIREFGFRQPVVIDKDNEIIIGHGRLEAAKHLGFKAVPCVIVDDLSDEQIKALRLADNKTNESDWDYDLLNIELGDILNIDMEDFGFDFVDEEMEQLEHEKQANIVQGRVENILNLGLGEFKGTGKYDIPELHPVKELPAIKEWIPFNFVLSDDHPEGKAVHFFIDDYQFQRIWNNPEKYIDKLSKYVCVATPDFSPYADMPNACQIFNHYRKHWVGAYLQSAGITVIPTIRASRDKRSLEWYLDGEPHNGIVMISSMWTNTDESKQYFIEEYNRMYDALNPCKVFMYGYNIEGLRGDIEHIKSFAQERWEK